MTRYIFTKGTITQDTRLVYRPEKNSHPLTAAVLCLTFPDDRQEEQPAKTTDRETVHDDRQR